MYSTRLPKKNKMNQKEEEGDFDEMLSSTPKKRKIMKSINSTNSNSNPKASTSTSTSSNSNNNYYNTPIKSSPNEYDFNDNKKSNKNNNIRKSKTSSPGLINNLSGTSRNGSNKKDNSSSKKSDRNYSSNNSKGKGREETNSNNKYISTTRNQGRTSISSRSQRPAVTDEEEYENEYDEEYEEEEEEGEEEEEEEDVKPIIHKSPPITSTSKQSSIGKQQQQQQKSKKRISIEPPPPLPPMSQIRKGIPSSRLLKSNLKQQQQQQQQQQEQQALPSPTSTTSRSSTSLPLPTTTTSTTTSSFLTKDKQIQPPNVQTFLKNLHLPLNHLYPIFVSLGCTTFIDLLALSNESDLGLKTRGLFLNMLSFELEKEVEGGEVRKGISKWERLVLEEGLREVGRVFGTSTTTSSFS